MCVGQPVGNAFTTGWWIERDQYSRQLQVRGVRSRPAVQTIADNRKAKTREVAPYLVLAPGADSNVDGRLTTVFTDA